MSRSDRSGASRERNLTIISHPLIQHNLTQLRDQRTDSETFRRVLSQTAALMLYEVTREFPVREVPITTPVARTRGQALARPIVLVPVLRAGLGMLDGILHLLPNAQVGHIGLFRHKETLEAVEYYTKLPRNLSQSAVILIDPMLATGNSATAAARLLKKQGARQISLVCLVAAPEGLRQIQKEHPEIHVYTAALDKCLNDHAYIVPGLGDAGDRLFGT